MTFKEIQDDIVKSYRVKLNPNSDCWRRTHAHPKKRMVCKWKQANSIQSTFTLLHEVGHIECFHAGMRRAEDEFYATVWAMEQAYKYGIKVPQNIIDLYQDYIDDEKDRGIRRGGKDYGVLSLKEALGNKYNAIVG